MRGISFIGGENVFKISQSGIEIFPRLKAEVKEQTYYNFADKISTGIHKLDEMMQGGLPRGTVTLVSGGSGTGKTTLALNFVLAGLKEGEKALFITLEENPSQIIHSCLNLGIDLREYIDSGLLVLDHVSPIELDVDEHVCHIQQVAKDRQVRRLVIDSISSFELGIKDKIKYTDYIFALTDYLKTQQALL